MWKNPKYNMLIVTSILVVVTIFIVDKLFKVMETTLEPFKYINDSQKQKRYIDWITPTAKIVGKEKGIPWEILVLQSAIENGWGKSSLMRKHNNFGGVKFKGSGATGKVLLPTTEYIKGEYVQVNSYFATWPTPIDGLRGYAHFYIRNGRYKKALQYPTDPYNFIAEAHKAGYATDPNYTKKIHGMLNKYKLA